MKIMNHYYCKDAYEARQIEQKYIDIFNSTMNSVRAYSKSFINEELDRELEFELIDYSNRLLGCFLYDFYLDDFNDIDIDNQCLFCEYCNTSFKTTSALNNHKNKAKYCLSIQGKIELKKEVFKCNLCEKILSTKQILEIHKEKCKGKKEKLEEFKCKYCFTPLKI